MKHYCYIYLDPRKPGKFEIESCTLLFEPIYIGVGIGNRFLHHLSRTDHHPLTQKIKKIQNSNLEPFILKIFEGNRAECCDLEINLISKIGRYICGEGPLCNITSGGDGVHDLPIETRKKLASFGMKGKLHTEETKNKMSNSKKKNIDQLILSGKRLGASNKGRKKTIEQFKKLSKIFSGENNPRYGIIVSEDTKNKISKANSGKKRSKELNDHFAKLFKGDGNPNAKWIWKLESISGEYKEVISLFTWCKNNQLNYSSIIYTLTSNKFYSGYRIISKIKR